MSRLPQVVFADVVKEAEVERKVLDGVAEVHLLQSSDEAELLRRTPDLDVLIFFHEIELTERSLARLPRCKGAIRCGVGFNNIDVQAAGQNGIVVCNVPDYGTEEVADHALMLLLAVARRLVSAHERVRGGGWDPAFILGAPRLRGRTLGILGCGRIGTALAVRAKALGLRVVFYDPYKPPGYEKAVGVERSYSLDEFLPQAEFLSLHCPLTRETRHILNARTLALLPRGAYVVNTSRGGCVDLDALFAALESGQVAYAGLDVVEREPLDDERIRQHPRVVLTPHAAFYSVEAFEEMRTKAALEAKRLLTGEPVRNPVNLHCLVNPRAAVPRPGSAEPF